MPYSTDHNIVTEINKWLLEVHCIEHKAKSKVLVDGDFYTMDFELNNSVMPYSISGEFNSEDAFIDYVKKQLKNRVHSIKYYKIQMLDYSYDETCNTQNTNK